MLNVLQQIHAHHNAKIQGLIYLTRFNWLCSTQHCPTWKDHQVLCQNDIGGLCKEYNVRVFGDVQNYRHGVRFLFENPRVLGSLSGFREEEGSLRQDEESFGKLLPIRLASLVTVSFSSFFFVILKYSVFVIIT